MWGRGPLLGPFFSLLTTPDAVFETFSYLDPFPPFRPPRLPHLFIQICFERTCFDRMVLERGPSSVGQRVRTAVSLVRLSEGAVQALVKAAVQLRRAKRTPRVGHATASCWSPAEASSSYGCCRDDLSSELSEILQPITGQAALPAAR